MWLCIRLACYAFVEEVEIVLCALIPYVDYSVNIIEIALFRVWTQGLKSVSCCWI